MKVLFVDDEPMVLELLEDAIGKIANGEAAFIECHTSREAIDAVEREKPEILFIDHNLSKLSEGQGGGEGLRVVQTLSGRGIRMISITSDPNIGKAYELMGIEFIDKFDSERMKRVIEAAFAAASDG